MAAVSTRPFKAEEGGKAVGEAATLAAATASPAARRQCRHLPVLFIVLQRRHFAYKQALATSYAARLKTGTTVLIQPILQASLSINPRGVSRRAGNDQLCRAWLGDELDGAPDSDDSEFGSQSTKAIPVTRPSSLRVWTPGVPGTATPSFSRLTRARATDIPAEPADNSSYGT